MQEKSKPWVRVKALLALCALVVLTACQTPPPQQHGLTAAQVALLKQQGFEQTDIGWELGLSSKVLFGNNIGDLNAESRLTVDKIGRALASVGIGALRVDGHTDDVGEDSYNEQLSLRRANAVAEVLVKSGLAKSNITVRGLGKKEPAASNRTPAGRSENRRVAIVVLSS
jgi:outer membrane protein OmpA-like peptidoglycan-associated protein